MSEGNKLRVQQRKVVELLKGLHAKPSSMPHALRFFLKGS